MNMFSKWLSQKYLDWRGDAYGRERSITEFAKYIGVDQSAMSAWMNGTRVPKHQETISKLTAKFGNEVLIQLGKEPTTLDEIIYMVEKFPEDAQPRVLKEIQELYQAMGLSPYEGE
jgi:transcriptional regulator with XRE-family HTH domain